jgi:hypothetical protein
MRPRVVIGILLAAAVGWLAYEVTGSSELAYILRALTRAGT